MPDRRRERELAVLLVRRMRRDDIGADRQRNQRADDEEAGDSTAVLRVGAPEFAEPDGARSLAAAGRGSG